MINDKPEDWPLYIPMILIVIVTSPVWIVFGIISFMLTLNNNDPSYNGGYEREDGGD